MKTNLNNEEIAMRYRSLSLSTTLPMTQKRRETGEPKLGNRLLFIETGRLAAATAFTLTMVKLFSTLVASKLKIFYFY